MVFLVVKVGYNRTLEANELFQLEGDWTVRENDNKVKVEFEKLGQQK